jgi:hypothetical protein
LIWGVSHICGLYKESDRINIVEIVKIRFFFPSFVGKEENDFLVEEVFKEELKLLWLPSREIKVLGLICGQWIFS